MGQPRTQLERRRVREALVWKFQKSRGINFQLEGKSMRLNNCSIRSAAAIESEHFSYLVDSDRKKALVFNGVRFRTAPAAGFVWPNNQMLTQLNAFTRIAEEGESRRNSRSTPQLLSQDLKSHSVKTHWTTILC